MRVADARSRAREWVEGEASTRLGFVGAYLTGSTKWRPADAVHTPSSDVDVRVIVDREESTGTRSKAPYRGILLEAAFVTLDGMGGADEIAANLHLAGSLWNPVILADPEGAVRELGAQVTERFPQRRWVEERGRRARGLVDQWLGGVAEPERFADQVTRWLFGTSATTLVLLTAGLRNPTVRRRYADCRGLLEEHGLLDFHEEMLEWLGCRDMTPAQVSRHLDSLAATFDATVPHVDAEFRFAADLTPAARPVAIDGSRELIGSGLHREAVFWIAATRSRCVQALHPQAPPNVRDAVEAGLRELLHDLGIVVASDLGERARRVLDSRGRVDRAASAIRDAVPGIVD